MENIFPHYKIFFSINIFLYWGKSHVSWSLPLPMLKGTIQEPQYIPRGCDHQLSLAPHIFATLKGDLGLLKQSLLPPWVLGPNLGQKQCPCQSCSCPGPVPQADFPPTCQSFPKLCQIESDTLCHHSGDETEAMLLFLLAWGRSVSLLNPVPRKSSLATIGNNVLGTSLGPPFHCSLTLAASWMGTGCAVSCSPAPNCHWEVIKYRLMH